MSHTYLLKEFEQFSRTAATPESLMQHVSKELHAYKSRYNWVGFYLADKKHPSSLALGPHTGSFTPRPVISFNEGICGSAAATRSVMIANNVADSPHYILASDLVKSQISIPVMVESTLFGVFNVESYFLATFKDATEREFVESCVKVVGNFLARAVDSGLVNA